MQAGIRAAARLITRHVASTAGYTASVSNAVVGHHVGECSAATFRRHGGALNVLLEGFGCGRVGAGACHARGFAYASTPSYHGHGHGDDAGGEKITVTFIEKDGTETVVKVGFAGVSLHAVSTIGTALFGGEVVVGPRCHISRDWSPGGTTGYHSRCLATCSGD